MVCILEILYVIFVVANKVSRAKYKAKSLKQKKIVNEINFENRNTKIKSKA